jgi:outer membrane lipoprotein SlyB
METIFLYQEQAMRKSHWKLISGLLFVVMGSAALAQAPVTPKAQYTADSKAAQTRYEADKKLCNDEASSAARLQCRRDAKSEYDKVIASAKAQLAAASPASAPTTSKALCADCGKVTSVTESERKGESSPAGLIAGGVAGALLGNQVGGGSGKSLATIAGAAGGAYAGKKVEEKMNTHKVWIVHVRYEDGRTHQFEFNENPGLRSGDLVKNSGNSVVRY